jgi:3-hydroxypropanoate dehydrogenase
MASIRLKERTVSHAVNDEALDTIFRSARTHRHWQEKPVSRALLMAIYDLMRWGPTTANVTPARVVFAVSKEAKERLRPHLDAGNVRQTMAAPATAILGYDLDFARHLPTLYPLSPGAKDWFKDPEHARTTAFRNASLQGGYFIMAARALGLDCGPMSGFDNEGVDREFFDGTAIRSNFLCNLGYGDHAGLRERGPRLSFDEACKIV